MIGFDRNRLFYVYTLTKPLMGGACLGLGPGPGHGGGQGDGGRGGQRPGAGPGWRQGTGREVIHNQGGGVKLANGTKHLRSLATFSHRPDPPGSARLGQGDSWARVGGTTPHRCPLGQTLPTLLRFQSRSDTQTVFVFAT